MTIQGPEKGLHKVHFYILFHAGHVKVDDLFCASFCFSGFRVEETLKWTCMQKWNPQIKCLKSCLFLIWATFLLLTWCVPFQEDVSTLQRQGIRAPAFYQLRHHDGHRSCRWLQVQGMIACNKRWLCAVASLLPPTPFFLGLKVSWVLFVKGCSLEPDLSLPVLGRSLLHIKVSPVSSVSAGSPIN